MFLMTNWTFGQSTTRARCGNCGTILEPLEQPIREATVAVMDLMLESSVDKQLDAPLSEFERVTAQYPVFRVVPESVCA